MDAENATPNIGIAMCRLITTTTKNVERVRFVYNIVGGISPYKTDLRIICI